jgi:hypothetical protein
VDYTLARSALAVPSRGCAAVSIGGELPSELPSIGLFTEVRGRKILRSSAPCRGVSRPSVVDRNIRNFVWYGGCAGDGLRSGLCARLPTKSVCSIVPLARHLRAGGSRASHPAAVRLYRRSGPLCVCVCVCSAFIILLAALGRLL